MLCLCNIKSEYILRAKPLRRNNNGLEPIGLEGFKARFKNIVNSIGLETTVSTLEKAVIFINLEK